MTNCSTETYDSCIICDNSNVFVDGGDFEGHTSEGATWKGFFTVQNNGYLIVNKANIHFENYINLPLPENHNIMLAINAFGKMTDVKITTEYTNKNYISGTGKIEFNNLIQSANENIIEFSKTLASLKEEILRLPFAYGVNYSIFIKCFGELQHTAVTINNVISAMANGTNTKISDAINLTSVSDYGDYTANISAERDANTNELVFYFNQTRNLAIPLNFKFEYYK